MYFTVRRTGETDRWIIFWRPTWGFIRHLTTVVCTKLRSQLRHNIAPYGVQTACERGETLRRGPKKVRNLTNYWNGWLRYYKMIVSDIFEDQEAEDIFIDWFEETGLEDFTQNIIYAGPSPTAIQINRYVIGNECFVNASQSRKNILCLSDWWLPSP